MGFLLSSPIRPLSMGFESIAITAGRLALVVARCVSLFLWRWPPMETFTVPLCEDGNYLVAVAGQGEKEVGGWIYRS